MPTRLELHVFRLGCSMHQHFLSSAEVISGMQHGQRCAWASKTDSSKGLGGNRRLIAKADREGQTVWRETLLFGYHFWGQLFCSLDLCEKFSWLGPHPSDSGVEKPEPQCLRSTSSLLDTSRRWLRLCRKQVQKYICHILRSKAVWERLLLKEIWGSSVPKVSFGGADDLGN